MKQNHAHTLVYIHLIGILPTSKHSFQSFCMSAKSLQSCPTLWHLMDHSLSGSSVHGILQQEYWSRLPCPPPGDLPDLGIEPASLSVCIGRQVLYHQSHLGSLLKLLRSRALLPDCYDSDITTENWISIIS